MLDIVMPVPFENLDLASDAIIAIAENTKIPMQLIVMVDGGTRKDLEDLEGFLSGFDRPWKLMHNTPAVGLNQSICEGLAECREKIAAIIGPEVRILDPGWFGKVQQIFHREPATGIVDTIPNTKSSTLHPVKRAANRHPDPGCRFMVVNTAFAKKSSPRSEDPAEFWSRQAAAQGGVSWHAGGIRYTEVDHEDHELRATPIASGS